ncbi:hypothetical protein IWQ61_003942 [Dispira simplex]|nr:hypothetical protein IWQ61_003942 [Dispira simplex]
MGNSNSLAIFALAAIMCGATALPLDPKCENGVGSPSSDYPVIIPNAGDNSTNSSTGTNGKVTKYITLEVLQKMYPEKAKNGCTRPKVDQYAHKAAECLTLEQVIKPLHAAFEKYNINNAGAQRAVTDIMAFESGKFFFKTNNNPKNHGQGTYAQLSGKFVTKYVESIPELKTDYEALKAKHSNLAAPDALDAILALANKGDYPVMASSWFLSTADGCGTSMIATLAEDTLESYMTYIDKCIWGGDKDKRTAQFNSVLKNVPSKSLG